MYLRRLRILEALKFMIGLQRIAEDAKLRLHLMEPKASSPIEPTDGVSRCLALMAKTSGMISS